MEQQEKFEAVLKKSVAMYSMLTGKPMSVREGRAFIEIFDMTDAYMANGTDTDTAASTFDILSQVELRGPTDAEQRQRIAELVKNPPQFVGREPALDFCGCPVGYCTCTNEMRAEAAHKMTVEMAKMAQFARAESSIVEVGEVYVDPASPEGDKQVTAEVSTDAHGAKTVTSVKVEDKKRYTPPPITSADRDHIPGYDWQICVLSREKNTEDSYIVHYAQMPTQAQFSEHFVKFHERTHYVHVNEWVNYGWEGITEHYDRSVPTSSLSRKNEVVRTAPAPELRGRDVSAPPTTSPWEQDDKPWRIRYYSDVAGGVIFTYVDKRPTSAEMAHFHHAKCMAVSQAKPKQAA